jgi:hypothetical protein
VAAWMAFAKRRGQPSRIHRITVKFIFLTSADANICTSADFVVPLHRISKSHA